MDDLFYVVDYYSEPILVNEDIFTAYMLLLKTVLHYEILSDVKYYDVLGGVFRSFFYKDPDLDIVFVGFNNVEV